MFGLITLPAVHPTTKRIYEAALHRFGLEKTADVARKLNVSHQTLTNWHSRGVSNEGLLDAATALGVSHDSLRTGKGHLKQIGTGEPPPPNYRPLLSWEYSDELPPGDLVAIPRMAVHLGAGPGQEQPEFELVKDRPQIFAADWIRRMKLKPDALRVMYAKGNSMEPRIYDSDALVVDLSQTSLVDGTVYALYYDDGERVKRLSRRPGGGLVIASDNDKEYPTIALNAEEAAQVRIIGRVVNTSGHRGL